jgi:maleylacetoacetate isomerase
MQLYTYFRSSAAWRVRIALALKGLSPAQQFIHLLKDGGQQHTAAFREKNPLGVVPVLEIDDPDGRAGAVLTQSLAIVEWLEETHPTPRLLPAEPLARAQVRAFALAIACDIHPLNNLRVLRYLKHAMDQTDEARDTWYRHWIAEGLAALEALLRNAGPGPFCFGDAPGIADICLVPQMANARRYKCMLDAYPMLQRAEAAALALPAFRDTAPERQPDAS